MLTQSFETSESIRNDKGQEHRVRTSWSCFNGRKEEMFCIVSWMAMKSEYITIILTVENREVNPTIQQQHHRLSLHGSKLLLYILWDQLYIIYHEVLLKENGRYTGRDTTMWFCNKWKPTWGRWNGMSYSTRLIQQTLPLSIITFCAWWYIIWPSSTSILINRSKNGLNFG